jgi:hypothetical protein
MARITVLEPTALPLERAGGRGPDAGPLRGKTVGIRTDGAWRSWEWTISEWLPRLEAAGATVKTWRSSGRTGAEAAETKRKLEEFATTVDVAVVGLGN